MKNYYAPAVKKWISEYQPAMTLSQWLRCHNFDTAREIVNSAYPFSPEQYEENAAMWLWYMAARQAGDRLTFNATEIPEVGINTWKRAATIAPSLIHPDVFSLSAPYQLVIA